MEASFFRSLAEALGEQLAGARIEKVHGPADGVTVLTLHGPGRSIQLIFRPAKTAGLLFASAEKPQNPAQPPARIMWLRKRLTGRRLLGFRADWPNLRLAFALSPRDVPRAGAWLVFDLREDLALAEDFPAPKEPSWPGLAQCLDDPDIWRAHPQLTPALRKRLAALAGEDPVQAQALLQRLASGAAEGFWLPESGPPLAWEPGPGAERFESAMQAARVHGERTLFPQLALDEEREVREGAAQAEKRRLRQLALLDRDTERHRGLAGLATAAEALQTALSGLKETPRQPFLRLEHPALGPVDVPLDPRLTPAQNMARLFALAAKGRRGLEHVARRRQELSQGDLPEPKTSAPNRAALPAPQPLPKRFHGLSVASFRSSDGFLILRGKSSKANHEMLSRAASPFDYWLHAAGGPSAHVILKRDHPGQDVPERTLLEAAGLCALKSWRKDDARAEVLLALVRDVRKVKGAALGSVAVDQVQRTLAVALDPTLEARLAH